MSDDIEAAVKVAMAVLNKKGESKKAALAPDAGVTKQKVDEGSLRTTKKDIEAQIKYLREMKKGLTVKRKKRDRSDDQKKADVERMAKLRELKKSKKAPAASASGSEKAQ